MSTIKVDTITTRTGSGNITVSNALSGNNIVSDANIATGISSSKLSGALPTLDGSALTGLATIGVGQTSKLLLSSRAKDTEYQNTTGKPIFISVSFTSNFTHRERTRGQNILWFWFFHYW